MKAVPGDRVSQGRQAICDRRDVDPFLRGVLSRPVGDAEGESGETDGMGGIGVRAAGGLSPSDGTGLERARAALTIG